MNKPMSGIGITTLLNAVDAAIEKTKGLRNRSTPFLAALHAGGFDVVELENGPVQTHLIFNEDEAQS